MADEIFEKGGDLGEDGSTPGHNELSDPELADRIAGNLGDDGNLDGIGKLEGLNLSTNDVMDMVQNRRLSNFTDTNPRLLSTDASLELLEQFKKLYIGSISDIQESGFHPLDNKLAKLLILTNGGTVRDYFKIGKDATLEELIRRDEEFQESWNNNFFNIGIQNPGKIKISHRIDGDEYISVTKWNNEN